MGEGGRSRQLLYCCTAVLEHRDLKIQAGNDRRETLPTMNLCYTLRVVTRDTTGVLTVLLWWFSYSSYSARGGGCYSLLSLS